MRKTIDVTYQDRGVDKTFTITEMSAMTTQDFLIDCLKVVVSTGILDMDEDVDITTLKSTALSNTVNAIQNVLFGNGLHLSKLSNIDSALLGDLRQRLLACCSYKVEKFSIRLDTREKVDMYIEDQSTLFKLQKDAFVMSVGFLKQDALPTSQAAQSTDTQAVVTSKRSISRLS